MVLMKKLSLYVFLGLFVFNSAYAEVYYCTDGGLTGFNSKNGVYSENSSYYKPERFTANIDFEKLQFSTKGIMGFVKVESNGETIFSAKCEMNSFKDHMTCINKTHLFSIRKNNLEYVRSLNHGGGDSIYIGFGRCEKF